MDALKLFQEYMGTGLIVLWFLVSLLYLWLTEKRKYIRVMFLYVPLVLLLVFLIRWWRRSSLRWRMGKSITVSCGCCL